MKGELAQCANPRCQKEFIKTRVTQKCCGNATCRTMYNRHKNGEPLIPASFKRSRKGRRVAVSSNVGNGNAKENFSNNLANGILNGAVGPAITSAIGRGTFVGNIAASAVSSAVIPLIRDFINSGNKIQFSSIDDDMNYWIRQKEYWEKERAKIDKGVLPIKSIGGGVLGGLLGFFSVTNKPSPEDFIGLKKKERKKLKAIAERKKKDAKRNALIGGLVLGGIGAYVEHTENQHLKMNAQALADNADVKIFEAEQNIQRLRKEKATMQDWVDDDILVQDSEGTYTVNPEIFNSIMTADAYKSVEIPQIEFKGAYKLLLSKAREKFYKLVGGRPEQGKTSYCVKFATYYSQVHGKVLYLPAEQSGTNADFQEVLRRVGGRGFDIDTNAHQYNLQQLLARIKGYDLVILDSINDMRLSKSDVKAINERVAVLGVMQSTKAGDFKGGQEFLHDCDKFILIDQLTASASKSRGTDPTEERERIPIDKLTW